MHSLAISWFGWAGPLACALALVSLWGGRSDAHPVVKLTAEGDAAVNTIALPQAASARIDIHVTVEDAQIFNLGDMTLKASASGALSTTDITYENGWQETSGSNPLGPLDPESSRFGVSLPSGTFGPGEVVPVTLTLTADPMAPPGSYTLNITKATFMLCRICLGFGFAEIGDELIVEILETLAADLDIKPGGAPNSINPMSRGVIPVAILGSDTFDVADVDTTTLAFGPGEAAPAHRRGGHARDVNGDGFVDLVSHYRTPETGITFGDAESCVTGATFEGVPFEGCDAIVTVPYVGERRRIRVNRQR
jgi:hypothetical protein